MNGNTQITHNSSSQRQSKWCLRLLLKVRRTQNKSRSKRREKRRKSSTHTHTHTHTHGHTHTHTHRAFRNAKHQQQFTKMEMDFNKQWARLGARLVNGRWNRFCATSVDLFLSLSLSLSLPNPSPSPPGMAHTVAHLHAVLMVTQYSCSRDFDSHQRATGQTSSASKKSNNDKVIC